MSHLRGRHWTELDTPRLIVDASVVDANIARFHSTVRQAGAAVRSHVKTHKTPAIARKQIDAGAVGIAAAKVSEAEVFVDDGVGDVVVAYPVFGEVKWRRMAQLARRCRLTAHVENAEAIDGLAAAARHAGSTLPVRVEIDTGFHRTGVDARRAIELARRITTHRHLEFDGITSHRSIFFPDAGSRSPKELALDEGHVMVEVAEQLRAAGLEVRQVAAGSTPTGPELASVDGITEVCAGTYVFYDAGMTQLGINQFEDVGLWVGATVVAQPLPDRYTIDAGAKTFTKDTYPGAQQGTFGHAADRPDHLIGLTDEHGIAVTPDRLPSLGAVLRFYPMHVCPVVNLADDLIAIRDGFVEDVWTVAARGRNR